jgi:hypothetical protein
MQTLRLPEHVRRRISVAAQVDPRTVKRFCDGVVIKGMAGERIVRALKDAGLLNSEPEGDAPATKAP